MRTPDEYKDRVGQYYLFIDEMLELFKGQLSYTDVTTRPYRELVMLRETRIKRLKEEKDAIARGDEKAKAAAMSRQFEEMVMNMR